MVHLRSCSALNGPLLMRMLSLPSGFSTGPLNAFGSTQFVKSFVPALVSIPLVFLISKGNQQLKLVTPYSELARGGAPAKKSLMVNYAMSNAYAVTFKSARAGHFLVTFSCLAVVIAAVIQPLAGSLFLLRSTETDLSGLAATGLMTVGLNPITPSLIPFVQAAGFVSAAVSNNLADPPLIRNGWTIPPYQTNDALQVFDNATLLLNTPALQHSVQCIPGTVSLNAFNNLTNPTVSLTSSLSSSGNTNTGYNSSCQFSVTIDTPTINWQSGAVPVDPSCNQLITTGSKSGSIPSDIPVDFRSVAFWVYSFADQAGATVFCTPQLSAWNALVETNITTNKIVNITTTSQWTQGNNVTGYPMNGLAYNGLSFTNATQDKFTTARSTVIPITLADAVLTKGKQLNGGLLGMVKNQTALVTTVAQLYTQFLAVSAATAYFVPSEVTLQGTVSVFTIRLWVDPFAAHSLAGLCALLAVLLAVVYTLDMRKRRSLFISTEPGSIAASAAVLSQSRFARTLIRANQTPKDIEETLRGMKFGFDMRTWAIEAEGYNGDDYLFYAKGEGMTPRDDNELEQTGLLAAQQMEMNPYTPVYPPSPGHDATPRRSSEESV
ncbi:hypothetical protein DL93DRAFT_317040 [Clavulina sp. PMI_390]|nr:hypothetical protein DL93DRAFT_317040 [Clavulina sp. PMI_390]